MLWMASLPLPPDLALARPSRSPSARPCATRRCFSGCLDVRAGAPGGCRARSDLDGRLDGNRTGWASTVATAKSGDRQAVGETAAVPKPDIDNDNDRCHRRHRRPRRWWWAGRYCSGRRPPVWLDLRACHLGTHRVVCSGGTGTCRGRYRASLHRPDLGPGSWIHSHGYDCGRCRLPRGLHVLGGRGVTRCWPRLLAVSSTGRSPRGSAAGLTEESVRISQATSRRPEEQGRRDVVAE